MKPYSQLISEIKKDFEQYIISKIKKEYRKAKIEKKRPGVYWIYRWDEDPDDFRADVAELAFRSGNVSLRSLQSRTYEYYSKTSAFNERVFDGALARLLPTLDSNVRIYRY